MPVLQLCGLSLIFVLFYNWLSLGAIGQRLEPQLLNFWFSVRGPVSSPSGVVVVAVDEGSYSKLGLSFLQPLPRSYFVQLLDRLKSYDAKAVVFDGIFNAPSDDSELDQALAKKMSELPTFVGEYQIEQLNSTSKARELVTVRTLDLFTKAARGVVNLNCLLDFGVWRRIPFVLSDGVAVPAMAKVVREMRNDVGILPEPRDYINFYGPPGAIHTVQIVDVLADDKGVLTPQFHNAVVFVGTKILADVGFSRKDAFITPVSNRSIFGVEVHATVVGNLIHSDWIRRIDPQVEAMLLNLILLVTLICTFLAKPQTGLAILASSIGVLLGGSYLAFRFNLFLPCLMLSSVVLPLLLLITLFRYYRSVRKAHREMAAAFGVANSIARRS